MAALYPNDVKIPSLQDLCMRRICADIARHAAQWKAEAYNESSPYLLLQMLYHRQLLSALPVISQITSTTPAYIDIVNFICNQFVQKIEFSSPSYANEVTAQAITRNCKKLRYLRHFDQERFEDFHVRLLESMNNLVVLRLEKCRLTLPLTDAIRSLQHLKILSLRESRISNKWIMNLCGYRNPESPIALVHYPVRKNCNVNSGLNIHRLDVRGTTVGESGLEFALAHIQTLRWVGVQTTSYDDLLSKAVLFAMFRAQLRLQLDLESVGLVQHPVVLKACLESCPKLKELQLRIINGGDYTSVITGRTLNEHGLSFVKTLHVECRSLDEIFNEHFKTFWERTGHQIKDLKVSDLKVSPLGLQQRVEADFDVVEGILALCPNLESLSLQNLVFRKPLTNVCYFDFPQLKYLENLILRMHGDTRELNTFALRLILSASNLHSLHLYFMMDETILPYILKGHLFWLKNLFVEVGKCGVIGELSDVTWKLNRVEFV